MYSSHVSVAPDMGPKLCPPGEVEVNGRCKGEIFAQTFGETNNNFRNSSTVLNVRFWRLSWNTQSCFVLLFFFSAAFPPLLSRPTISPELVGQSVHLRCSFIPPPWSQPLGFLVVWARRISHSMKVEIRQELTMKPFSLVEMDGVHFRLGETVIPAMMCQGLPAIPQIILTSLCQGSDKRILSY